MLDTGCGFHIFSDVQGLKRSKDVEHGKIKFIMGNWKVSPVTKIGVYTLLFSSGLGIDLNNFFYSSDMSTNIIFFNGLYKQGFTSSFDNEVGAINAYYNGIFFILEHYLVMVYMKLRLL